MSLISIRTLLNLLKGTYLTYLNERKESLSLPLLQSLITYVLRTCTPPLLFSRSASRPPTESYSVPQVVASLRPKDLFNPY